MSDSKCYAAFTVITFGLKWYKTEIFYTDAIICVGVIFLPFVRDENMVLWTFYKSCMYVFRSRVYFVINERLPGAIFSNTHYNFQHRNSKITADLCLESVLFVYFNLRCCYFVPVEIKFNVIKKTSGYPQKQPCIQRWQMAISVSYEMIFLETNHRFW